jgi:hypothetical protein
MIEMLEPDRNGFANDPFGYSALAWYKWGNAQMVEGFSVDSKEFPLSIDLKEPILWLAQAHALSEAALTLIQKEPTCDSMPVSIRGICDSQFCAAGLMLVGYSLEICLKGLLILDKGVDVYTSKERQFQHHKLEKLAEQVPNLSGKDKAILRVLTHFTEWAGRYPDPGSGRDEKIEEIFVLAEKYQVTAKDLFALAAQVMKHTMTVVTTNSA